MTEREAFEAWATIERLHLAMEEGEYMSGVTRLAHRTWMTSRKQMAEEAAAVCAALIPSGCSTNIADVSRNQGIRACADAIRALATPTEGKT